MMLLSVAANGKVGDRKASFTEKAIEEMTIEAELLLKDVKILSLKKNAILSVGQFDEIVTKMRLYRAETNPRSQQGANDIRSEEKRSANRLREINVGSQKY